MVLRGWIQVSFSDLEQIFLEQTSDICEFGCGRTAIEAIKELKKSKRELKSMMTRALNNLAIRLAAKELDHTQISASLVHIEGKKEEALAIMRDLETEFDKIKKTEEAEKIGDEADALVD